MQILTFENKELDQKIIVTINDAGDDWNIDAEFFPELLKQDRESLHYLAASLVMGRMFGKADPSSITLS